MLYHSDNKDVTGPAVEQLSEAGLVFLSFRMTCRRATKEDFTCPMRMALSMRDVDLVEEILAYRNGFDFVYEDRELNQRVFYALIARQLGVTPVDRDALVIWDEENLCPFLE